MRFAVVSLAVLALAACSNTTGPTSLTGSWTIAPFTASDGTPNGTACTVSSTTMALTRTGATLTGTYSGAVLTCNIRADSSTGSTVIGPYSGQIIGGAITGNSVNFALDVALAPDDSVDWVVDTGTVSGASMHGKATIGVFLSDSTVTYITVTGPFRASKH